MAEVKLQNVTKTFPGGVIAVDSVNLTIRDREFVVLVGPSGCGKSTTLRMVAGLEEITSGTVSIGDRVVNDVPPKNRDIAMVFQNYALYPHMTVYRNLAFALKLRRMPRDKIDSRVRDAAKVLGIDNLLERKPRALSGGQRQRVAVGRAIVRQPKAFLFDEPLSNLDAKLRVEMRAELKRLHSRLTTTTIYVTHDQEEAMTLGDRVVVMKEGVVHQCGGPLEVYEEPANRFVAGFLGTPPMNFLDGKLVARDTHLYFDEGITMVRLAPQQQRMLADRAGESVVMGIRPDGMATHSQGRFSGEENSLPVSVGVIEPLGQTMDIHVNTPRHPYLVARIEAQRDLEAGQNIKLYLDMGKTHFFEPGENGQNITAGAHAQMASV